MATIKSNTDISQSRKLAEILPLESADMEYIFLKKDNSPIGNVPFVKDDCEIENSAFDYDYNRIPCWSLAALLNILPNYHVTNNGITGVVVWSLDTYSKEHDNPVDACYEMILKLNELKML